MNNYNQILNVIEGFKQNIGVLARVVNDHTKALKEIEARAAVEVPSEEKIKQLASELISAAIADIKKTIATDDHIKKVVMESINGILNAAPPQEGAVEAELSIPETTDDITIVEPVAKSKRPNKKKN